MNDLVILLVVLVVGFVACVLLERRQRRCFDAAQTMRWQSSEVPMRATLRGILPASPAAPSARNTLVGY